MENRKLKEALSLANAKAKLGKPSYFDEWWYFDTNCISELVKMNLSGDSNKVDKFLIGKNVLLTSTSFLVLRSAPSLLQEVPNVFDKANLYLAPDISKFWYSDFINFFYDPDNPIEFNSLDVFPLGSNLIDQVINSRKQEFDQISDQFYLDIKNEYQRIVRPDVGSNLDERDLCIHIRNKIKDYGKKWFNLEIPTSDLNPINFPSFYVFYYAYYFRYSKNRDIKIDLNDVVDLENCMVLPYCEKYYCDASFSILLSTNVKGLTPPSAYNISKRLFKKGYLKKETFDDQKRQRDLLKTTGPLLPKTEIYSFREMRNQILGSTL